MNRTNDDGYVAVFTVPAQSGNVYFLIFRVRIVFFKGVFFFLSNQSLIFEPNNVETDKMQTYAFNVVQLLWPVAVNFSSRA